MGTRHQTTFRITCLASTLLLGATALAEPATRPAAPAALPAGTQPAATAPAQPEVVLDARAQAVERHKHMDEQWKRVFDSQRQAMRTQWSNSPVTQTFKPGSLVRLSLSNGVLKADTTDVIGTAQVRVGVEGSNAIWTVMRTQGRIFGGPGAARFGTCMNIFRFDFDARDEEIWQTRIMCSEKVLNLIGQNAYGNTTLSVGGGMLTLRVSEYGQFGQPPRFIIVAQAPALPQLRAEHPEEFRAYVLPLLGKLADPSFLQPGAADVYSAFGEIPADQTALAELEQIVPLLDAPDPGDRDAASAKLRHLGGTGVLAAMRMDDSALSEEQKVRLQAYVGLFRHRTPVPPGAARHDLGFLIDCLEFEDVAVRNAARAQLERQCGETIPFDTALSGEAACKMTDDLRKRLLVPRQPIPNTTPATQPAPQA